MPCAELHAKTNFSFLEGASHPDELVRRAAELGCAGLEIRTGKVLWKHSLPAGPVRWGVAIDRNGRVVVSLGDGRAVCFGTKD